MTFSVFKVEQFLNFGDTALSINIPNTIGNIQEYLVSLDKQNQQVRWRYTYVSCIISNKVAILKGFQPYLSNAYHIW